MVRIVLLRILAALSLSFAVATAQEDDSGAAMRQQALAAIAQQIRDNEALLREAKGASPRDTMRIAALEQTDANLRDRLAALATGLDVAQVRSPKVEDYELQKEVTRLLKPLVRAVSEATEAPRQIQALEAQREQARQQLEDAESVVKGLEATLLEQASRATEPAVREELQAALARWRQFAASLREETIVLGAQLDSLERSRAPVAETVQNAVATFVRRRGFSIVLALGSAALVVFVLRSLHRGLARVAAKSKRQLPLRLFEVGFQALALLGASFAVVLVFYLRGDFELLALVIVFFVGLGWALSKSLPSLLEQLRLLFNAGAVREGERVVLDGLPYRVEALRFYCRLVNPELEGGVLRVPLRELVGKTSRRQAPDEPWFPTPAGDWALFPDGAYGLVETATPERVVVRIDGTPRHYRTQDYLGQQPANLSRGFVLYVPFGIDYRHQGESTKAVPERLRQALVEALPGVPGGTFAQSVGVEFQNAAASSLDLVAVVRFAGGAAPNFGVLRRAIAAALVDASTKHGYAIPFPQVTVHRGAAS